MRRPHDIEAERSIVAAALGEPLACVDVIADLPTTAFYHPGHASIWGAIQEIFRSGGQIDLVTVTAKLKELGHYEAVGGSTSVVQIAEGYVSSASVVHYATIVREQWDRRRAMGLSAELSEDASNRGLPIAETVSGAALKLLEISAGTNTRTSASISELIKAEICAMDERRHQEDTLRGVSTGLSDLDDLTHGLQAGDLIVLAARPSMGKTALAVQIAAEVGFCGKGCLFFSLEMTKEAVARRVMANRGRVNLGRIASGRLATEEYPKLVASLETVGQATLVVDDASCISPAYVRAKAIEQSMRGDLGLIVVDYLQLMQASGRQESREREIATISQEMKRVAKDLQVPVVLLSQLNRSCEARTDKRPLLSDLRESGSIEQDADLVMFLYRDDYYNPASSDRGITEVLIRKHRNGATGKAELRWFPESTRFESLATMSAPVAL